jgi:hypothetical protein
MVPALDPARFRMPLKRGKDQLIRPDRSTNKDRHARQGSQFFSGEHITDSSAGNTIERQAEGPFVRIIRRDEKNRLAKIRVEQTRMRDQ